MCIRDRGNMACAAAKLGARTAFIGQVGDDAFGRTLRDVVQKNGVDAVSYTHLPSTPICSPCASR